MNKQKNEQKNTRFPRKRKTPDAAKTRKGWVHDVYHEPILIFPTKGKDFMRH
ncbi:MAG: hypothetical protein JSS58_07930 [Proteobacteria bacterium]|nr:hypothetical protein [Pseudomonadota bacterium]